MQSFFKFLRGTIYLARATIQAVVLGIIETATNVRGRRFLAFGAVLSLCAGLGLSQPFRPVDPGVVAVRINRLTGSIDTVESGWALVVPGLHQLRSYPAGDRVYRPERGRTAADGYQTAEGLGIGVEVTVRYTLDPANPRLVAQGLPEDLERRIIEPVIDAILHRVLAQHSVRQIYATERADIEAEIVELLTPLLLTDGVTIQTVFLGTLDLPESYRAGLESMLAEELAAQKMVYTLELKEKAVKESELMALAEKARREQYAEASAQEEIIAARGRAEAMRHVLPLKEKEIEQRRLEAEASKVTRLTLATAEAEARRIEAGGEADYRKKVAESDAYRVEVLGRASSEALARDAQLITQNPLLIQKSIADKLSDKIQVIIAPPEAGGFFAGGLLGQAPERSAAPVKNAPYRVDVPDGPHVEEYEGE
jgi:regulator of protease activity HflC (stomatin/prohibitin superfamily)